MQLMDSLERTTTDIYNGYFVDLYVRSRLYRECVPSHAYELTNSPTLPHYVSTLFVAVFRFAFPMLWYVPVNQLITRRMQIFVVPSSLP